MYAYQRQGSSGFSNSPHIVSATCPVAIVIIEEETSKDVNTV